MVYLQHRTLVICLCTVGLLLLSWEVEGHGRLREPPSRSSMWRDGFNNPTNYNDNELNCGGRNHQWQSQGGKCGICGDPYNGPRLNEAGGRYANGVIVRRYKAGDTIDVNVEITAQHKGWFKFHLCANNDVHKRITQECLDRYPLTIVGHGTQYNIPKGDGTKTYRFKVLLPPQLTCTQCVLQWKWNTGNSWGRGADGKGCVGCGPQEQFYGCSDVAISSNNIIRTTSTSSTTTTTQSTTQKPSTSSTPSSTTYKLITTKGTTKQERSTTKLPESSTTTKPNPSDCKGRKWFIKELGQQGNTFCQQNCPGPKCPISHCICESDVEPTCEPTSQFADVPDMQNWCDEHCWTAASCPETHCVCTPSLEKTCRPSRAYHQVPGMQQWCEQNCLSGGNCPKSHCLCD